MEKKINIAELLKDCPIGMELDCLMYDGVTLNRVISDSDYPITITTKSGFSTRLTKYGQSVRIKEAKCVIFPKGKTTWEGFVPPCKFKDGDVVTWEDRGSLVAFIYKERKDVAVVKHHFALYTGSLGTVTDGEISLVENEIVLATEEEKQKLFQAIKDNGYKWNEETKTLEKLIEPKFKVGDRVKHISAYTSGIVVKVDDKGYHIDYPKGEGVCYINFTLEKDYELAPNKFDITTLKTFDKVLVRDKDTDTWEAHLFSRYYRNSDRPYICIGCEGINEYKQCIPYDSNKELLSTTNDCDEFYITW